jgi:hypothetical protein
MGITLQQARIEGEPGIVRACRPPNLLFDSDPDSDSDADLSSINSRNMEIGTFWPAIQQ